jgi:hypothetical protein
MSDTSTTSAVHPAVAATNALVDVKAAAENTKAEAESVLEHIHDVAVNELTQAKTFGQHIAPYAITAVAALSVGLLIGHFA